MSLASERDNAVNFARTNPAEALLRARKIHDTWYRCQALAWVAWLTPDSKGFLKIIDESAKTAAKASEAYQACAVLAWPLNALVDRGHSSQAKNIIRTALKASGAIDRPTSKADALFDIWQAAFALGIDTIPELTAAVLSSCLAADSPKCHEHLREMALMAAPFSQKTAKSIIDAMPDGRYKRQAERRIEAGEFRQPRSFFWVK